MVALLDGGGTGVVALRDLVECFRVATRLAIDADAEAPAPRGEATDEAKVERAKDAAAVEDAAVEDDEPVDPELAWWIDEEAEAAAARAKADADAALDKADDPAPSLAAGGAYGAVTEADVHELVDVLFSEHDELLIEELERATVRRPAARKRPPAACSQLSARLIARHAPCTLSPRSCESAAVPRGPRL